MNDAVRQALAAIVANYGDEFVGDERQIEGLLRDVPEMDSHDAEALVRAVRSGVVVDLLNAQDVAARDRLVPQLVRRLQDGGALSEAPARDAVETWAAVVGAGARSTKETLLAPVPQLVVSRSGSTPDGLIPPEAINSASLKQILESAALDVSVDTDGDLIVTDGYRCYLRPDPDGRLIAIYAIFGVTPGASDADKLVFVNRVNDQVKLVRASVSQNGKFFFDYYLSTEDGITNKRLVTSVRRFLSCLGSAVREDSGNVVA
jgi:hypothetical protein